MISAGRREWYIVKIEDTLGDVEPFFYNCASLAENKLAKVALHPGWWPETRKEIPLK